MSYVIWQEQVNPFIVVELLSSSTQRASTERSRSEDLGQTLRNPDEPPTKWEVYEQFLQVPYAERERQEKEQAQTALQELCDRLLARGIDPDSPA